MIAVVVPTVRPECWDMFIDGWDKLFKKHEVVLLKVQDGDTPRCIFKNDVGNYEWTPKEVLEKNSDLIFNKNDGVRNLGFAVITQFLPNVDTIITLDDDTLPIDGDDPIQAHLDALNTRFPLGWMSTASDYVRGIPYWNRNQSECVVSHGVWEGVMDWDAPTQLVKGNRQLEFYKGVIPRGVYFPFCLHPESKVDLSNGDTKLIKDINIGDDVYCDKGETHKVLNKSVKKVDEDIVVINHYGSKEPIKVTKEHKILTMEGWREAKDITKQDYLCIPKAKHTKGILCSLEMYLLGVFLAEGNYLKQKNMADSKKFCGIAFTLSPQEKDTLAVKVRECMAAKFNKLPHIYNGKSYRLEYYGKDIAEWFYKYCGEYSYSKKIEDNVVNCDNITDLIRGLFEGDGYCGLNRNNPIVSYHTISEKMAIQVKNIINRLGFYCNLSSYKPKNRKWVQYKITLYGLDASKFSSQILLEEITYNRTKKESPKGHINSNNYVFVKIKSVSLEKYSGDVYDITVQDNHTFTVNGCVVHNCGMNVAFKRKMLPYMYYAPMGYRVGMDRFADIWLGINLRRICDDNDWSIATGYSTVRHERASNVWANLKKEAQGLEINEHYFEGVEDHEYFKIYNQAKKRWQKLMGKYVY